MMLNGSSGLVKLDPPWYDAGLGFAALGIQHILTGFDHLLFLLCLVIPFRRTQKPHSRYHCVYGGALGNTHRDCFWLSARRQMVSTIHRNGYRRVHRLHGGRKHHWS